MPITHKISTFYKLLTVCFFWYGQSAKRVMVSPCSFMCWCHYYVKYNFMFLRAILFPFFPQLTSFFPFILSTFSFSCFFQSILYNGDFKSLTNISMENIFSSFFDYWFFSSSIFFKIADIYNFAVYKQLIQHCKSSILQ